MNYTTILVCIQYTCGVIIERRGMAQLARVYAWEILSIGEKWHNRDVVQLVECTHGVRDVVGSSPTVPIMPKRGSEVG